MMIMMIMIVIIIVIMIMITTRCYMVYTQSAYSELRFQKVRLQQTLDFKGWEFPCPYDFIGSLPESSTQGLLVGKLLVGGPGVTHTKRQHTYKLDNQITNEYKETFMY